MQTIPKNRPAGVTIIGILTIVGGILILGSGITLAALAAVPPNLAMTGQFNGLQSQIPSMFPASYLGVASLSIGTILIIMGIVSLIVACGLFKAKKWAWTISVALSIINIAIGVISIVGGNIGSIANIAISGIILYYLYRPHVKAYFGKSVSAKIATP